MRLSRFFVGLTFAAAVAAGCGDSGGPAGNSVSVVDNEFNPDALTVAPGTTVTWSWAGTTDHNVTWDAGTPAPSPTQTTGTYSRSFGTAGTFDYFCSIHGSAMSGTITVQ